MTEEPKPSIAAQIRTFFKETFTLDDVNYTQSIKDIKDGVSFKGFNIWILICSILIASLGLNMNSTAVVIGAMLISPLMGPIVGLGLGIGIYDKKLIIKSLKNIGVATFISIVTAFVFFKITPTEEVNELLSRTRPTLLDLFVAFFGGIAGILAAARCLSTNTIPGVAIATALMPPLCTAGFGLAIGNWDYFAGAFFLFLMNCIMISIAALLVVLYLRYPKFSFVDDTKKRQVRAGISFVLLLVLTPSVYFYYNLLEENLNEERIENFLENEIATIPGVYINSHKITAVNNEICLNVNVSGDYIEPDSIISLNNKMTNYSVLGTLKIIQPQPIGFKEQRLASLKTDIISELYQKSTTTLQSKDDEINLLKSEVKRLSGEKYATDKIVALAKSQFSIEEMAVDILVYTTEQKKDTLPTALVGWDGKLNKKNKKIESAKLLKMLQIQLDRENIRLLEIK
jgi:uncharacterized hydrophobic protein (TIGR00271 family)